MFGGDSIYLGGLLNTVLKPSDLSFKENPKFHFVDFMEFADVLGMFCAQAVQAAIDDTGFQTLISLIPSTVTDIQTYIFDLLLNGDYFPPETYLNTLNGLRSQFMALFGDSQYMLQGLYPIIPQGGTDNQFVAYLSTLGTCDVESTANMLLPVPFVENMRALTKRCQKTASGENYAYGIIGQYALDVIDPDNYYVTVNYQGDNYSFYIFPAGADGTLKKPIKDLKKEKEKEKKDPIYVKNHYKRQTLLTTESAFSLVDGSSGGIQYAINSPGAVNDVLGPWNNWIANGPVSNFFSSLTSVATDGGIDTLTLMGYDRFWNYVDGDQIGEVHKRRVNAKNLRRGVIPPSATPTPYSQRVDTAVISQVAPDAATFEQVINQWILPVYYNQTGLTIGTSDPLLRMAILQSEPYIVPISENTSNTLMSVRHYQEATMCVRSKLSSPNKLEEFFTQQAKLGRGGILSELANIASAVLPAAAQGAATLLPLLPF